MNTSAPSSTPSSPNPLEAAVATTAVVRPPVAALGAERWPLLGLAARVWNVVTDPTGLAMRAHEAYGDVFTLKIPTFHDLTYVFSPEAYRQVLAMDPDLARMGPVMGNVPGVGFWFPRAKPESDHASLQALMLASRTFMSECVSRAKGPAAAEAIDATYARMSAAWGDEVDFSRAVWPAVFEASCRGVVGDELWDELATDVLQPLRDLADAIDVLKVTLASTPAQHLMKEYRAARALHRRLVKLVDDHRRGPARPFVSALEKLEVSGAPVDVKDLPWLVNYVLWNATVYPGTYATWTLADLLAHPDVADEAYRAEPASRRRLLEHCFHETLRLHPLASIVRHISSPVEIDSGGKRYRIEDGYIGLLPYEANRDPERFSEPERWDPRRYVDGRSRVPMLFGRGAFSCVAQGFSTDVTVRLLDHVLTRYETTLIDALPPRQCRVHLTYPTAPIRVRLKPRQEPTAS